MDIPVTLLLMALLPPIAIMIYIYRKDKAEKEPLKLLLLLLIGGVLSIIPAILIEKVGGLVGEKLFYGGSILGFMFEALYVGFAEEGGKLFFLKRFSWKNTNFDYMFDGIVYAVFVSLGFAAFENVKYVFNYGVSTALSRAITSIPGHTCFALFMGIFYSRAKLCEKRYDAAGKKTNLRMALIVPMLIHAGYDFCCFTESTWLFIIFLVAMYIVGIRLIKTASSQDIPLVEPRRDYSGDTGSIDIERYAEGIIRERPTPPPPTAHFPGSTPKVPPTGGFSGTPSAPRMNDDWTKYKF